MLRAIGRLRAGGGGASLDLDFSSGVIDSRLTCSGGANGTRVNSAGVIVAATCPRFDYDSVAQKYWLLIEGARTNSLLNSTIDGANLATQSVTVTAVAHTLTFYGTGTVTLSGVSTAGPLVGSGAYPTRSTLTFTPTAGSLTLTVSGAVQFAQLEIGAFATSYIPTAGAAVTRTADIVTMTGANFSSWYNQTQGTFVVEASTAATSPTAAPILTAQIAGGADRHQLSMFTATSATVAGGAVQANMGTNVAQSAKLAYAYAANDFAVVANGGTVETDTSGTVPSSMTYLTIGKFDFGGGLSLGGRIPRIRYYPNRLPNAQLQALTAA
jgi:hypothetical protein